MKKGMLYYILKVNEVSMQTIRVYHCQFCESISEIESGIDAEADTLINNIDTTNTKYILFIFYPI